MPKFRVVSPVEHDQILYLPKGATPAGKTRSAGTGQEIPVDPSGVIELDEVRARAFSNGQITPISDATDARPEAKRTRR